MFDPVYVRQAKLLLRCFPEIGKQPCFALKGGTAINLFLRSSRIGTQNFLYTCRSKTDGKFSLEDSALNTVISLCMTVEFNCQFNPKSEFGDGPRK